MDTILLRFIGADRSMGLRKGHIYEVKFFTRCGYIYVDWGSRACPYSSISSLLRNWEEIA